MASSSIALPGRAAVARAAAVDRRSSLAAPVAGFAFLLLVAFSPATASPWFTARAALALVAGAMGVPLLWPLARRGDVPARLAVTFVAWAAVSAALSGSPLAWTGRYSQGTGAVFIACLAGVWAIGRHLDDRAASELGTAIATGAVVNAAIAVLQGPFDLGRFSVFLYDERSTGLLGNPIFLASACAAGLAALSPLATRRPVAVAGGAAVLAAATQMAGSRVALALLVFVGLWGCWRARGRRVAAVALALSLLGGAAAGAVLQGTRRNTTAVARIAVSGGGLGSRTETWRTALQAVRDRPLAGYGPGRYYAATSPRRTLRLVRLTAPGGFYADAHDVVVEYLTTTGIVGAGLLGAWLLLAARGARGARGAGRRPLLVGAGVLLAVQLLEPQNVAITPLTFLLLGAAGPWSAPAQKRPAVASTAVLGLLAVAVAGRLVVGDVALRSAVLDFDLRTASRASALLRPWAAPLTVESRAHVFAWRAQRRPDELVAALASVRRAEQREPDDGDRATDVGRLLDKLGRRREAADAYARALVLEPWSVGALESRADALSATGRPGAAQACRRLARLARPADEGRGHEGPAAHRSGAVGRATALCLGGHHARP